jgi:steroid 5-alpha reductase family enzyme
MSEKNISLFKSFLLCIMAYTAAIIAAFFIGGIAETGRTLYTAAIMDISATAIIFFFSFFFNNSSFYDPYWSAAPPAIVLYFASTQIIQGTLGARAAIVIILVFAWAIRLTWNWASQWQGFNHEDWRYADIRKKNPKMYWITSFLGFHLMPTVLVFVACIPLLPAVTSNSPLGFLDLIAVIVTASAIIIEALSDLQLRIFQKSERKPEDIMQDKLWKYSRHPNYFGEISFWWGIFIFGIAADFTWWWSIIGAVLITGLFNFISIPLIENRMISRRPLFNERKKKVSAVIPMPLKK